MATMLVLTCTNTVVSLFRKQIPHEIRIPIYVMIIATTVTVVQLLMNAYTYTLYQALGIFIPLIVTNCIVIGRAEAFASKNSVAHAAWDGFSMRCSDLYHRYRQSLSCQTVLQRIKENDPGNTAVRGRET